MCPKHNIYHDEYDDNDEASACTSEALEKIFSYWSSIWQRLDDPDTITMQQYLQRHQVEPKPQREWDPVAAPLYYQCALKQKGKAGSTDGWSGSEVGLWPFNMWQAITSFFHLIETLGAYPSVWGQIRQAHLPKQGRQRQWDGATPVSKLRPVAIMSVFWRIYIGARLQSHQAQAWYQEQLATQQHGSRRKRDVTSLAEAHASNQFIASLDLSQAFDRIRPARAVACLIHYGFPLKLAKAVEKLWQNQQRFLGWSSECRPQAATVSSSIPQGDSLSPWVLNILLAAPTKIIAGLFPSATQVVYVDDRSFACPTVNMLRDLWAQWRNHSVQLGLKENRSKTQVYARTAKARRQLETDPDFAEFAKDQLTALGVCFCPGNTKPSDKQKARFAEVTALRARCAPVVAYLRQFMATTAATAKAVFGWIVRGPPRYLTTPLEAHFRKVGFAHVAGSVHLIKLIFGHGLDVSFMAGQSAVTAVFRFCQVAQRNLLDWNKKGGLSCRVRQFLRSLGFQERGQFFWQHRSLPTTIDLTFLGVNAGDSNELCHRLRLAWRWLMWTSMQKQERLDTARVRNVPFDAERIQRIRSLCSSPQTAHVPAIACGAFVSPMRFAKITRVGTGICPFCEKAPGTADHVFWRCPVTNPNQILPCDDLEAVFGWPDRDNADCLHHMAHVRKLTLALRYPRGGGGGGGFA